MAIGIIKKATLVAVKEETTEGVAEVLTDGDDFFNVLEDGLEVTPSKELVERAILIPTIGQITPRTSTRGVTGSLPVEWAGAGNVADQTEAPDYFTLLESCLGVGVTQAGTTTTGVGTVNTMEITGNTLLVGDFVTIETAGAFHNAFVTIAGDPTVTFDPPAPAAIGTGVVVSPSIKYATQNANHPSFTQYVYWGNEIAEVSLGCRAATMALENFTTGQIPNLAFGFEGLTSDRSDSAAPFVPITTTQPPPVALGAVVTQGALCIDLNEVGVSLENTMSFLTSVKSADGKISSRFTARTLTGTMNPYMDDTDLTFWETFESDLPFSVIITLGIPDPANPGELIRGSSVGMYLPNCLLTENAVADVELLLVENLAFIPNAGPSGSETDIYMAFS